MLNGCIAPCSSPFPCECRQLLPNKPAVTAFLVQKAPSLLQSDTLNLRLVTVYPALTLRISLPLPWPPGQLEAHCKAFTRLDALPAPAPTRPAARETILSGTYPSQPPLQLSACASLHSSARRESFELPRQTFFLLRPKLAFSLWPSLNPPRQNLRVRQLPHKTSLPQATTYKQLALFSRNTTTTHPPLTMSDLAQHDASPNLDDGNGTLDLQESNRGTKRPRPAADDDDDDDDKPGRERRKIEIKFIQDKSRRHITFSKRKAGIMKKVRLSMFRVQCSASPPIAALALHSRRMINTVASQPSLTTHPRLMSSPS